MIDLPRLLSATERYLDDDETAEDLKILLAKEMDRMASAFEHEDLKKALDKEFSALTNDEVQVFENKFEEIFNS